MGEQGVVGGGAAISERTVVRRDELSSRLTPAGTGVVVTHAGRTTAGRPGSSRLLLLFLLS